MIQALRFYGGARLVKLHPNLNFGWSAVVDDPWGGTVCDHVAGVFCVGGVLHGVSDEFPWRIGVQADVVEIVPYDDSANLPWVTWPRLAFTDCDRSAGRHSAFESADF